MQGLPSFFVPFSAYFTQLLIAVLGAGILLAARSTSRSWLLAASAYPVGAAIAGFVQWATFVGGVGFAAVPTIGLLTIASFYFVILRIRDVSERPPAIPLALGVLLIGVGFLVSQSEPLSGDDSRYQIGYRAKVIASFDGFHDGKYWNDPEVLHINPKYPLHMSSLQAVTLRVIGRSNLGSETRAVSFAFFVSFVILLTGYSVRLSGSILGTFPVFAFACIPRLWSIGLDEGYADFPLGVYMATSLIWAVLEPPRFALAACTMGVAGVKAEGVVIVALFSMALVVFKQRSSVATAATMISGALVSFLLFKLGVAQTNWQMPMENVQLHEITISGVVEGLDRLPVILRRIFESMISPMSFGLFFPLALVAAAVGGVVGRTILVAVVAYFGFLTLPFLVTRLPLDFHMNSTLPRFGLQVVPSLCVALAECLAIGRLRFSDLMNPCR